jgi:hypothetical protein
MSGARRDEPEGLMLSQAVKDWLLVIGGGISVLSFAVAAGTFVRNGFIERDRWRAHLAVQPVSKDVNVVLAPVAVHLGVEADAVYVGPRGSPTPPAQRPDPSPQRAEPATPPEPRPRAGGSDTIHLLVRNSSFRPAAIVKVALRDAAGKEVQINEREYGKRFDLPTLVSPWQIMGLVLEFHGEDYSKAETLVIIDMDDHEVEIPLGDRTRWRQWYEFPN